MTFVGSVSHMIPGMMSLSVLGRSTQMIPKTYWDNGKNKGKRVKHVPMMKGFTEIMMGTTMIKPVAGMVSGL